MGTYLNNRIAFFFVLLFAITSLLYSSTLNAPFNFDDEVIIKAQITELARGQRWEVYYDFYPPKYRHLFYSSLLLNFSLGELNTFGYHLANTSLHLFTSIVIFFIAFITIEKGLSLNKKDAFSIASITTLLFSINSVHSETVNYISARAVGMSSFFYLSALLSFILGCFRERKPLPRFLLYFSTLICFLASILSKETALTFPIVLLLYDVCFMRNDCWAPLKNRLLFFYLPLFLCSLLAVLKILSFKNLIVHFWQKIDAGYGLKQIRIIGYGARLLLLPIGLTFDYDFPSTFFPSTAILATAILLMLGIILAATLCFPRSLAMVSFCTLWFLLTLAPTNSIFPRPDLLSERNLYLPSLGVLLLLATTIHRLVLAKNNQLIVKKIGGYCLIIFFIFQIVLLHERNLLYRSNTILWEDTLEKAPGKLRALHNLSHFYIAEKNHTKAFTTLRALVKSKASPHYISYAHSNLGAIYLQMGDYLKAENEFKSGIRAKPSLPANHFNLGTLLASQGRNLEAKESYDKAENLYKKYLWGFLGYQVPEELYINKARLLLKLQLYDEAESSINDYLNRAPESGPGYFVRANIYLVTGRLDQALHQYNQVGLNSYHTVVLSEPKIKAEAHNNRALIFIKKKSFKRALEELNQAITISPNFIDAHYNLGNLLTQTNGNSIKARWHLEKALKLSPNQEGTDRIKRTLSALP